MKKLLSLLLIFCMLTSTIGISAMAFSDTKSHWAEEAIDTWTGFGVLSGYDVNTFRPNSDITRAETATAITRLMSYATTYENPFADIKGTDWHYMYILKAHAAGIINGYGNGKFGPNDKMTRQDAATIICRAFGIEALDSSAGTGFKDDGSISGYAKGYMAALVERGVLKGFTDGTVRPQANITRAELVAMVDRIIALYIVDSGTYSGVYDGVVLVKADHVILENAVINGNLIISDSARETISLINTTVNGLIIDSKAVDTWDGTAANEPALTGKTYHIYSAAELAWVARQVNSGATDFYGYTVKLMVNIDLDRNNWTPLGARESTWFFGTFDGNNKTIYNLTVRRDSGYAGLFGNTAIGGVKNLTIDGADITSTSECTGILVGFMESGAVSNCTIKGDSTVAGTSIVGGLIGCLYDGTVERCTFTDSLTVTATGDLAGGLAGVVSYGTLSGCVFMGNITIDAETSSMAGGLAGYVDQWEASVTNCSVKGGISVTGDGCVGGLAGAVCSGTVTGNSVTGNILAAGRDYVGGLSGMVIDGTLSYCKVSGNISVSSAGKNAGKQVGYNDTGTVQNNQV